MPGCHAVIVLWFTDPPQYGRFSPGFGGSGTQPFKLPAIRNRGIKKSYLQLPGF